MRHSIVYISLLFLFFTSHSFGQVKSKGIPLIQNYTSDDFHVIDKNVACIQDRRGIFYFANQLGVLEFDGTRWQTIPIQNDASPRTLAVDNLGRVYVGANNEFGYLQGDSLGNLKYVSLSDQLDSTQGHFGDIQSILITPIGIIFQAKRYLFKFRHKHIETIHTENSFDKAFWVGNRLYIREWNSGLLRLEGNHFVKVEGGEQFAFDPIQVMLPLGSLRILLVSEKKGCFSFYPNLEGKDRFVKDVVSPSVDTFFTRSLVTCGVKLRKNHIAIGTARNGFLVIDQDGTPIQHINQSKGLLDDEVQDLYLDMHHHLWAVTNMGISMVEIHSPFSVYNEKTGLRGRVLNAILHRGKLYVGTSQGIFHQMWQSFGSPLNDYGRFRAIANTSGYAGHPYIFQESLIYSNNAGVLMIQDTNLVPLLPNSSVISFAQLSQSPEYLLIGKGNGGLSLIRKKQGTWTFKHDIKGINAYCHSLHEDKHGNIWFSDYDQGIFKVKLTEDLDSAQSLKSFNHEHGLPKYSRNSIFSLKDNLVFGTRAGFYRFDEFKQAFTSDRDLNEILSCPTYAYSVKEDGKGNIWFLEFGKVGIATREDNQSFRVQKKLFNKLKGNIITYLAPIDASNVLLGSRQGLFHYNPNESVPSTDQNFAALIRKVSAQNLRGEDSLVFAGTFMDENQIPSLHQPRYQIKKFPYHYNNIRFQFAATWYENTQQTQYQCFLEGLDKEWSPWTKNIEKSYTNLPEGHYTFYVRAQNVYGTYSKVAAYSFQILAPWYRKPLAYAIYGMFTLLFILLLVRLNTIRLQKINAYLSGRIEQGLAEIRRKNQELEYKNEKIERSYQDIKLLAEIGKDITANLTIDHIVGTVYANINMLMDASVFGIGIYQEKEQQIGFAGAIENGQTIPDFHFSIQDDERLAIWCYKHKKSVFMNDYSAEYRKYLKRINDPITNKNSASIIYAPLIVEEQCIGVITVQSFRKNAYSYYHLDLIKNLAVYTSIALQNAKAYERLEELNIEKNHLISIVAHDLRNPLHHIYGLANVIQLDNENLTPKQKDYLARILNSTGRINQMITRILDMNAIESNKINLQIEPTDLSGIIREAQENLHSQAARKQIEVCFQEPTEICYAQVDKNYTLQVFENLLSNALKFSHPKCRIDIRLIRQNGVVRTEFIDQGPGMNQEDMQKVFGKFQRLSAQPTAGEPATGLGLSIVKKYVEAMQGEVWCNSVWGQGSTFVVQFKAAHLNGNGQLHA